MMMLHHFITRPWWKKKGNYLLRQGTLEGTRLLQRAAREWCYAVE